MNFENFKPDQKNALFVEKLAKAASLGENGESFTESIAKANLIDEKTRKMKLENDLLEEQIRSFREEERIKNSVLEADASLIREKKRQDEWDTQILRMQERRRKSSNITLGHLQDHVDFMDNQMETQIEKDPVKKKLKEAEDEVAISQIENIRQSEIENLESARQKVDNAYADDYDDQSSKKAA